MSLSSWCLRLLTVALLLGVGCDRGEPALTPVSGRVFYRGEPLTGGSIVFTPNPDKGGSGPLARGDIRPDGSFTLHTGESPGAVPGWHRVTVVWAEAPAGPPEPGKLAELRPLIPPRFAAPETSGLEGLVEARRENTIDFYLE